MKDRNTMVVNTPRNSNKSKEEQYDRENDEEKMSKKYWKTHGNDFVTGSNHTIDNQYLWTPPLAYQQSLIVETKEPIRSLAEQAKQLAVVPDIALFPLELGLKDYLSRLFDLLSTTLRLSEQEEEQIENGEVVGTNANANDSAQAILGTVGGPATLKVK